MAYSRELELAQYFLNRGFVSFDNEPSITVLKKGAPVNVYGWIDPPDVSPAEDKWYAPYHHGKWNSGVYFIDLLCFTPDECLVFCKVKWDQGDDAIFQLLDYYHFYQASTAVKHHVAGMAAKNFYEGKPKAELDILVRELITRPVYLYLIVAGYVAKMMLKRMVTYCPPDILPFVKVFEAKPVDESKKILRPDKIIHPLDPAWNWRCFLKFDGSNPQKK